MPTIITTDLLKQYFSKEGKKSATYKECVQLEKGLRVHADGIFPVDLLNDQRPSEPKNVMIYRKAIWQAITKETVSRIVTCLSKIRRSTDWAVQYDNKSFSSKIAKEELPTEYFEKSFPHFQTLTNWLFSVCLKEYLVDANAVCVVMPIDFVMESTDYIKPYPVIFNSEQVFEYVVDDYCVIKSKDKSRYLADDGKTVIADGDIFWLITYQRITRYDQTDSKGTMTPVVDYPHGLGYMPAFKLGGVYLKSVDRTPIFESRINSIVPRLNKAAREDNDLDVSVVRHLFPEKWEFSSGDCKVCHGIGKTPGVNGEVVCTACNGAGRIVTSPFQSHVITPAKIEEQQVPTPPAGYIDKDIEIVKLQDERIEKHMYKALASINMEFLSKTPMNESGVAKEVDRDELNNFVYSVAEDLVKIMDRIYFISFDYRYKVVVPINKDRHMMLPKVNVPEKYDILSVNYLIEEYQKAKNAKINPVIINKMEQDIANKKYSTDPEMAKEINAILKLDPFSGMTSDDKMAYIQNRFITQQDAVISANIVQFVRKAFGENDKFYTLGLKEQQDIMIQYAKAKIAENDKAAQAKANMFALPSGEYDADSDVA